MKHLIVVAAFVCSSCLVVDSSPTDVDHPPPVDQQAPDPVFDVDEPRETSDICVDDGQTIDMVMPDGQSIEVPVPNVQCTPMFFETGDPPPDEQTPGQDGINEENINVTQK